MMPSKTVKKKQQAAANDDDDLWNAAHEQSRTEDRTPKPSLGEYDEDPGREASKAFQTWSEWQMKFNEKEKNDKRQFAATLKAVADDHHKKIESLLQKTRNELNAIGDRQTKVLGEVCVINNSASNDISMKNSDEIRQSLPLFKTSQQLLWACRELVTTHEEANRKALEQKAQINSHLQEVRAKWNSDMIQLDEILQFGFDYGTKIVECSVSPSTSNKDKSQILAPDRSSFREAGQTVLDMYQKSTGKLISAPTWGEGIKMYTEKMLTVVALSEKLD